MTRLHCPFCGRSIGVAVPSNHVEGGEEAWRKYLFAAHAPECRGMEDLPVLEEQK